ncbi:hypothetical protein ACOI9M_12540 [Corynebacterium striatum]|uniref:hypothetical protein n=1 Tax=Corynebacterium striatum TaxID=43770 RepID=UPI003B6357CD
MTEDIVHNRIAVMRTDRRISRRELAEALGIHYQTIVMSSDFLDSESIDFLDSESS